MTVSVQGAMSSGSFADWEADGGCPAADCLDALVVSVMKYLKDRGVENPGLDARVIAMHVMAVDWSGLVRLGPEPVPEDAARRIRQLSRRRAQGEPVAYLTGSREFWGLAFEVSPSTLIPRPDSEILVETAISHLRRSEVEGLDHIPHILDLGTGSGALLISVLCEVSRAVGVGIDISGAALALAKRNARRHGVHGRARFVQGNWAACLAAAGGRFGGFDVVIANPPYIATQDIDGLSPDVKQFEPRRALDGGADGLQAYRDLARDLGRILRPGGAIVLEHGEKQQNHVRNLVFDNVELIFSNDLKDLAGRPRGVHGERKN